ncbi:MAG: 7-carboxy-7-deazaguanine synthase QueE [candidate division WOR-3 bacterium]|nr:7-carboxy-7-deazaguanine synthase QueE [candidate division WOR-3 bacterium]MCX7947348.1 7-carboxy-7-deazaguanine synthase QueE [candidate division WOR-3 bacterium]MDW8150096.1 7-carboxy-7-deazaguanine synthase QueE [candidate division WOR-3 bacterium]
MIPVSEIFYSIQGEGKTAGVPALFLRLAGCDVKCIWCDTKEIWMRGKPLNRELIIKSIRERSNKDIHLVITGGEPLIYNDFINELVYEVVDSFRMIEIETSATRKPYGLISYENKVFFNTSPKLKNSLVNEELRVNPDAIEFFLNSKRAIFKFVIKNEKDVIEMIETYKEPFNIPNELIYLMPLSTSREEFIERSLIVVELCKKYKFNFSPRLQLIIWDRTTGV